MASTLFKNQAAAADDFVVPDGKDSIKDVRAVDFAEERVWRQWCKGSKQAWRTLRTILTGGVETDEENDFIELDSDGDE